MRASIIIKYLLTCLCGDDDDSYFVVFYTFQNNFAFNVI